SSLFVVVLVPLQPYRSEPQRSATSSFDHFIGEDHDGWWDGEAERLSGLKVDSEPELGGQLYRQIARLGSLKDLIHIDRATSPTIMQVDSVAHQTTVLDMLAQAVHGRQPRRSRQRGYSSALNEEHCVLKCEPQIDMLAHKRLERDFEVIGRANLNR